MRRGAVTVTIDVYFYSLSKPSNDLLTDRSVRMLESIPRLVNSHAWLSKPMLTAKSIISPVGC